MMRLRRLLPALALVALGWPALADGPLRLDDLTGNWQGAGTFSSGTAEPGRIRCKIGFSTTARGTTLVEGRCASAEGSDVFGLEVAEGKAGAIIATNRAEPPGNLPAQLTGKLEPGLLSLQGEGIAMLELRRVGDELALAIVSGQAEKPGRMDVVLTRAAP